MRSRRAVGGRGREQRSEVPVDAAGATEDAPGWQSVMVDVSDLSLDELAADDDTVLARCLRRLAADLERPGGPIAGFNSAF